MKTRFHVIGLLISFILASCVSAGNVFSTEIPESMADNFSLLLRDSPCEVNILDTASGTLVHYPVGETTPTTISLQLSEEELKSIYEKAISINFFNFPAEILPPDNLEHWSSSPSGTYELSITNGMITHSVSWTSDIITEPLFTEAAQFMNLIYFIREIIKSHPEFKQLPEQKMWCA